MATKLFVGGLAYSATESQLRDLFATIGTVVSAQIIVDKFSQQSKGFAFVEMSTEEEAKRAVEELSGKEIEGRAIAVNEARPQEPREPRQFGGGNGGGFRSGGNDRRSSGGSSFRDGGRRY